MMIDEAPAARASNLKPRSTGRIRECAARFETQAHPGVGQQDHIPPAKLRSDLVID